MASMSFPGRFSKTSCTKASKDLVPESRNLYPEEKDDCKTEWLLQDSAFRKMKALKYWSFAKSSY